MRKLFPITTITLLLLMMGLVGVSNAQLFGRRRAERNFGAGVLFGAGGSCPGGVCSIPSASVSSMASVPMMAAPSYAMPQQASYSMAAPMSYSAAPQTYGAGSGSCYSSQAAMSYSAPAMSYSAPPQTYAATSGSCYSGTSMAYSVAPPQSYSYSAPSQAQEYMLVPVPKQTTDGVVPNNARNRTDGVTPESSGLSTPQMPSKSMPESNYRPSSGMPKSLIEIPDVLKGKVMARPARIIRAQRSLPPAPELRPSLFENSPPSILRERRPKAYIDCGCDGAGGCECGDRCSCEHVPVPTQAPKRKSLIPDWYPRIKFASEAPHLLNAKAAGLVDYSNLSSGTRGKPVDYSGLADSSPRGKPATVASSVRTLVDY